MQRRILLIAFSGTTGLLAAQDAGRVHLVTPQEPKPAPTVVIDTSGTTTEIFSREEMQQMEWRFTGTFTEAAAHPLCAQLAGDERKSCTAMQVLNEIRSRLEATPPAAPPPDYARVRVSFDVDRYGEVRSITVNYGGDDAMSQAVVTALYALPKFAPAVHDGTKTACHCSFSYAPSLLFKKP